MARPLRPAGGGAGLAALIAAVSLAPAQPPAATGTTLYLVVRTRPSVPDKRVVDTIHAGLEAAAHTIDGSPTLKPVSPLFFEQFAELIGSPRSAPAADAAPAGGVGIRPLPARDGSLVELKLPSAKQALAALSVRYQTAAGRPDSAEYTPAQPGDGPLTLIEPGRYAFRPEAGRIPLGYTATVDERADKTELITGKTLTGDWPQADRFFVMTLRNFRPVGGGRPDHERFLSAIEQQNQNTANPVQITRLGGDQVFVFADMAGGGARVGSLVVGNTLELRVPAPVGRTTRRAWVLFPLSETQYQDAVAKYAAASTTDLPAEVRKNAVPVGAPLEVGPATPAQWIEVPPEEPNPGVLFRRVPLKGLPQLAEKYPTVWQLTVWEFEHPTRATPAGRPEREAILVQDESGRDVSARGAVIPNWATELKRANP